MPVVTVVRVAILGKEQERENTVTAPRRSPAVDGGACCRALLATVNDVVSVVDRDGTIRYETGSLTRVLGYGLGQTAGTHVRDRVHPDDRAQLDLLLRPPHGRNGARSSARLRVRHADGSWRHLEATVHDLEDHPAVAGLVISHRDVTERVLLEDRLRHQSLHDPLTDLPNRTQFTERVSQALAAERRGPHATAVLILDLDDFKTINDGLGHVAGDELLRVIGHRLRAAVRETDACARLGGDQFGVVMGRLSGPDEAHAVALRLLGALTEPLQLSIGTLQVTASSGLAVSTGHENADELIRNADVACSRAQSSGAGHLELFAREMHAAVEARVTLRADLERGIAAGEFEPHYQPIVDLASERIVGVEALVRWAHPEHGLLGPGSFLPLAEESGLIVPLGHQVLAKACADATAWQTIDGEQVRLSVNLSAPELLHPDLCDHLGVVLDRAGLAPERLIVEITESMLVGDTDQAATVLRQLTDLGVQIALDDFGTGYSSLAYLHRFPVDAVKIDRGFVDGVGDPDREVPIAAAILNLGRSLGLEVVAEGVEHGQQVSRLRELGCRFAQGFHFARPAPADEMGALVARAGTSMVSPLA